jgi:hypothetical protein
MSIEIGEIIKYVTPLIAAIVGYFVRAQRVEIKEIKKKNEDDKKELIETFRDGLKAERKHKTDIMQKHERHIEEIFNKIKEICVENGKLKTELNACTKICDRIKFKK